MTLDLAGGRVGSSTMVMRVLNRRALWGCTSVLLCACLEPNPNADAADEVGTSDTSTATDAGTDGGTTAETTTAADTTDAGTTDAGTTDAGTTDTGGPVCADIGNPDECAAAAGCQPVNGSKLKENGPDSPCLEPEQFLGCIPEQDCDAAITWFCQGNGSYQVANGCGPDGFDLCDGPVDPVDACP